jgi:hypothetical protein
MKYLQDYMESGQTALFKEQKVFFAFSNNQLNEGIKKHDLKGVKLVSLGSGMYCPKTNARAVIRALDGIYRLGIEQDIKENGIDKIILRELYNHECFYTGDIADCVNKLKDYPITKNQIINIYRKNYDN